MTLLAFDMETFYDSDYTLKKMGTEAYIRDPRFEVIGVSVSIDQRPPVWMEERQFRAFIVALRASGAAVTASAHHAHFDGLILSHHYNYLPARWLCTLQMARAIHCGRIGNDLASLLDHHGLRPKGDYVSKAKGKRRADFTPDEWREYGDYSNNDVVGHQGLLRIFLPKFTRTELELQDITVRQFTEPQVVVDANVMTECYVYEMKRKEDLLTRAGVRREELSSSDKFAELLRSLGVEPPLKLNTKGDKMIYAFAKTDPDMQAMLEDGDEDVRLLCEARLAIKSTLNETRTLRMLKMGAGGRPCPVYLKYCGAHTWRWSGGDGVNWQNFERTNKKNPHKGMIRKAICAPDGKMFVVADSAQIHARETAWLAGQLDLLAQFRDREDVYSAFASIVFRRSIDRKNNPNDQTAGQLGKVCILALGFGMGWYKFAMEVLKGAQGADPVQFVREDLDKLAIDPSRFLANPRNIEIVNAMPSRLALTDRLVHCAVANHFVEVYRQRNRMIANLWKFSERVLQRMHDRNYGPVYHLGCINVCEEGLGFPDGTVMQYPGLQYHEGSGFSYLGGRAKRVKIYGGMLVENIVQKLERIIMGQFMVRLNDEYLKDHEGQIVMQSHDEAVSLVPERYAAECLSVKLRILNEPPKWAPGLPLYAEGDIGRVYGEIK